MTNREPPPPPWMQPDWEAQQEKALQEENERLANLTEKQWLAEEKEQRIASERNPFEGMTMERVNKDDDRKAQLDEMLKQWRTNGNEKDGGQTRSR